MQLTFRVPIDIMTSGEEVVILNTELKQRYYKKPFIDEKLEQYFDNLKETKCLSKDKITINFEFQQGSFVTSQLMWYSNTSGHHGDTVTDVDKASRFFISKIEDMSEDFFEFASEFDVYMRSNDFNKVDKLFKEYFIGKKYKLEITNKDKGYFKLRRLNG